MPRKSTLPGNCTVAATLEVIGEWWTLLIIRDSFNGVRRFEDFQRSLGIARNVLTQRLNTLVEAGIFERKPVREDARRLEYRLTEKGRELFPALMALMQWGDRHLRTPDTIPAKVVARADGADLAPVEVRTITGRTVALRDCMWVTLRQPDEAADDPDGEGARAADAA